MRISDWSSDVCSSDLSLPKAEIDIADVASSENAGGSVCRERLVVHSPVQADEVEGVAQRLQRAKDEGIEESNLDIRQRIERGKVIVETDDAVVVETSADAHAASGRLETGRAACGEKVGKAGG